MPKIEIEINCGKNFCADCFYQALNVDEEPICVLLKDNSNECGHVILLMSNDGSVYRNHQCLEAESDLSDD